MDLTTVAMLAMFGSAVVGGIVGTAIGWMTRFEAGLALGLVIFGGTTLWYAGLCLLEYQEFAKAGARGVWGEVIAVENRPVNESGSITQPVPVIRFIAPNDSSVHVVDGPAASGAKVGQHLNVIYDAADPKRSRIGLATTYRGGAIAFMLFGTFPLSFAVILIYGMIHERALPGPPMRAHGQMRAKKRSKQPERLGADSLVAVAEGRRAPQSAQTRMRALIITKAYLFLGVIGAIIWISSGPGELEQRFAHGFAAIALVILGYAIAIVALRIADSVWFVHLTMLALNFGVWAFALHLLS